MCIMNVSPKRETHMIAQVWKEARERVEDGERPKRVAAENKKTGLSIFDNVPQITCAATCSLGTNCYDVKLLRVRPSVMKARAHRHAMLLFRPNAYVATVISEIARTNYKSIRIFGGGDYHPRMLHMLDEVMAAFPNRTFYMISKTIRSFLSHAEHLLESHNFFLVISESEGTIFDGRWDGLRKHNRVNSAYTLAVHEKDYSRAMKADIVFNVSKSKRNLARYKGAGLPLCPCDAKEIPAQSACARCKLCHTKGGVRGNDLDTI